MASTQFSASLSLSVRDVCGFSSACRAAPAGFRFPRANLAPIRSTFSTGSPIFSKATSNLMKPTSRASFSIRCEQGAQKSGGGGSSVDVWLGRVAMIGFAVAISTEIATGKGFLENFGLSTPLPTVALAVTLLVGVLTAIFIFQSSSEN